MKLKLLIFTFLATTFLFGQTQVQKINRIAFIGQKLKFLRNDANVNGYMYFGKNENAYPWLNYSEFKERTARIVSYDLEKYKLRMDDNGEIIYFKISRDSEIPNNIGFVSILDSARVKYTNRIFYNPDLEECRIVSIDFAENDDKFSQLYGPYNISYNVGKNTRIINLHITETYAPVNGYTYKHQIERVFENFFKSKNPFKALMKSDVKDKFYVVNDKMENRKIYIHKNLANKDFIDDSDIELDFKRTGLLTKIIQSKNSTKIYFISNFYREDWIFHTRIKVKIGELSKQTSPVKGRREVTTDGEIIETNYYGLDSDILILKWIADNYTKDIKVRFYGKDYYDDFIVSMDQKLAIKETYDLYKLLTLKKK